MSRVQVPHHYVRLDAWARANLSWRRCFLKSWNRSSFFPLPLPSAHVYSDASGAFGCGAFVAQLGWFQVRWPSLWELSQGIRTCSHSSSCIREQWSGKHIRFHSDNMAVVAVLSNRYHF
jgi:hypothetical protein